ncbi:MAG: site-2 protease family protein [Terriglobia bacterium]
MRDVFDLPAGPWPALEEPSGAEPDSRWRRIKTPLFRVVGSLPFCVLLFLLTLLSALVLGAEIARNCSAHLPAFDIDISWAVFSSFLRRPMQLWAGAPYAATLLGMLLAHEMGHYLTCRYYRIDATYPYFIPAPTLIGTLGAFIRIRSPLVTRRELFDVGISGPIAGFVVALPVLIVSAWHAGIRAAAAPPGSITLGSPLAQTLSARLFHPGAAAGRLTLGPAGCGAWVGLFATALNLLPMGQLDGGHIIYAVFGRKHRYISLGFFAALFPLGIFCWTGWLVWAGLMLLIGLRHPAPLMDEGRLDRGRKALAVLALVMFLLCFTLTPFLVT